MTENYDMYDLEKSVKLKILQAVKRKNRELLEQLGENVDDYSTDPSSMPTDEGLINIDDEYKYNTVRYGSIDKFFEKFKELNMNLDTVLYLFKRNLGTDANGLTVVKPELTTLMNFNTLIKTMAAIDNLIQDLEGQINFLIENQIKINKNSEKEIIRLLTYFITTFETIQAVFDFNLEKPDGKGQMVKVPVKNEDYDIYKPKRGIKKTKDIDVLQIHSNLAFTDKNADKDLQNKVLQEVNSMIFNVIVISMMFRDSVNELIPKGIQITIKPSQIQDKIQSFINPSKTVERDDKIIAQTREKNKKPNVSGPPPPPPLPPVKVKLRYTGSGYPSADDYLQPIQELKDFQSMNKSLKLLKFLPDDPTLLNSILSTIVQDKKIVNDEKVKMEGKLKTLLSLSSKNRGEESYFKDFIIYIANYAKILEDEFKVITKIKTDIENTKGQILDSIQNAMNKEILGIYGGYSVIHIKYNEDLLKNKYIIGLPGLDNDLRKQLKDINQVKDFIDMTYQDENNDEQSNIKSGKGFQNKVYKKPVIRMQGRGFYNYRNIDTKLPSKFL